MRKSTAFLVCILTLFALAACGDGAAFEETESGHIVARDGTRYTLVGHENDVWVLGDMEFEGHVDGEKESFTHLNETVKTGMYSVSGEKSVLVRYSPDSEWGSVYAKEGTLKAEAALGNCIRFELVKGSLGDVKSLDSKIGIDTQSECQSFIDEITGGQSAEDAGLYELVRQSDGRLENCYLYGYVYGFLKDGVNIVMPMAVTSYDDKAYSIAIGEGEYVLPEKWISELSE